MKSITRKSDSSQPATETAVYLFDDWFDPIEAGAVLFATEKTAPKLALELQQSD
jgi:hypothetical protein